MTHHAELECLLLPDYADARYAVGLIQGTLESLAALGTYTNHAYTVGIVELDASGELETVLSRVGTPSGAPLIGASVPLPEIVSQLRRVLVDENALTREALWVERVVSAVFSGFEAHLGALVRELSLVGRELWVGEPANPRRNAFGFISDASFVLIGERRRFLLAAGWSD